MDMTLAGILREDWSKPAFKLLKVALFSLFPFLSASGGSAGPEPELVQARVNQEYGSLFALYKELHTHPELSFQEEN